MTIVILSAVMRGVWLIRNDFVFNKQAWSDVKRIWKKIWSLTSEWSILCKEEEEMKSWLSFLELQIREPLKISSA
jgi:hypothetical protein